jgi:hypothetical protein
MPRGDDGTGVIVLANPDDPIPQPKILLPDGTQVTAEEAATLTADDDEEDLDDISDLDDPE